MNAQDEAFLDADFNWVSTLQSVWRDSSSHVDELQRSTADRLMRAFRPLLVEDAQTVVGQVINGPAGSGKTHLVGTLRSRVWAAGGWFVLIDVVGITDFWRTAAFGFIRSLRQAMPDGKSQYQAVFEAVLQRIPPETRAAVVYGGEDLGHGAIRPVNFFVRALQKTFSLEGMQHSNVIRALLLQGDPEAAEIAYSWLQGLEIDPADRKALGLTSPPPSGDALVAGISWLMSLGGPVMIAIDQIDAIVTAGNILAESPAAADDEAEARARAIIQVLAGGLLDLHDHTHRAMTVVTCLTETWDVLRQKALRSALHRFAPAPLRLNAIASGRSAVAELIARRLAPAYARHGVVPPGPTWPFAESALAELEGSWPRQVLMRCEEHRQRCLAAETVSLCTSFDQDGDARKPAADLAALFARHREEAKLGPLDTGLDDGNALGRVLRETLSLYARQLTLPDGIEAAVGALASDPRPSLHARLTFAFRDQGDMERHFCFRVIAHAAGQAVVPRLRAAMTDSGIDRKLPFRQLIIVRNGPMPGGKVTAELMARLAADGGRVVPVDEEDLRSFVALRDMTAAKVEGFEVWLREAKPLCDTTFFKAVGLCPAPTSPLGGTTAPRTAIESGPSGPTPSPMSASTLPVSATAPRGEPGPAPAGTTGPTSEPSIPLGPRLQGGGLGPVVDLKLGLLTRHTAIFAGSGSGKTVLLRRIVEEATLLGVPAIVLDTNNDLARLGEAWPSRPGAFGEADAAKAARYAADVDVVVWTPGVAAGRPLTLAVLPDFAGIADPEERDQAVAMAWATLAPLVGATGSSKVLKEGVLREALSTFAAEGQTGIARFVDYLTELPPEVSRQSRAQKLAADMADQLRAKIAVNPLLAGKGQPLDPATLFTADRPGATRISVINFAGLEDDATRQDFVNQLQMALFTYIRRHPSDTPRLYVCDEAQNFAPSQTMTASKASAIALARQGRKFGLGMVFATQAPKGIDTNIVSNCVTHFYGRISSPAHLDAAVAMMEAKGRGARDLGGLAAGIFYVSTEGLAQPVKIQAPLCLTHHPQNPATPAEVVAMARRGG